SRRCSRVRRRRAGDQPGQCTEFFSRSRRPLGGRVPGMRNQSCWIVPGIVLLSILAGGAGECWRWLAPERGSAEELYCRLRVGMTQAEAIALICDFNDLDSISVEGITRGGREIHSPEMPTAAHAFELSGIPPPDDVEHCVIAFFDSGGRDIVLTLGP